MSNVDPANVDRERGDLERTSDGRPPLRIAQLAPHFESVPPNRYGGTERVVSWLTEALVAEGHAVTLFATGDSRTSAELVAVCPRALGRAGQPEAAAAHHTDMIEEVVRRSDEFDVIHNHLELAGLPLTRRCATPVVTTLHGRLDLPHLSAALAEFRSAPLVSISEAQRRPLPRARWLGAVHHGLPPDLLQYSGRTEGYLAFVGRISRERRVDRAVAIAAGVGLPLVVAAKIDPADRAYFEREIEPLFARPGVTYIGEVGDRAKAEILGAAQALLFPIDWPEPFGLVMIEAMACGTPVVAFRAGSVPEIVEDGVTGFVCDTIDEAVEAVRRALDLDRRQVRARFEARFTARRMAARYTEHYRRLSTTLRAAS